MAQQHLAFMTSEDNLGKSGGALVLKLLPKDHFHNFGALA